MRETDLYLPVKSYLEQQGYEVKGEISSCDVVAKRGDEAPIIVELKLTFSLQLVFQAIDRQSMTDLVYVAVCKSSDKGWRKRYRDIIKLCRMLGVGLITVSFARKITKVEVHLDPAPYQPRQNKKKKQRLLKEFGLRVGDPNKGGSTGKKLVTVYRQNALRCVLFLSANGATKAAVVAKETQVDKAATLMNRNVYGWFDRVERGVYQLTPSGEEALLTFAETVKHLHAEPKMTKEP